MQLRLETDDGIVVVVVIVVGRPAAGEIARIVVIVVAKCDVEEAGNERDGGTKASADGRTAVRGDECPASDV